MKQKKEKKQKNKKKYPVLSLRYFIYDFVRLTGVIPALLYFRPKIYRVGKKEKVKGAIMMSNHIGFTDPMILLICAGWRRLWSLATVELFQKKLSAFFFRVCNCIPVNRENVTIDMYHSIADVLSSDKLLAMFPEGKINVDNEEETKKFKGGIALFAIMNKVPVIPVYIVKKNKWYERQKIVMGAPIHLEEVCGGTPTLRDVEKVSEYLHNKEEELASYYREKCKKKNKENKDND